MKTLLAPMLALTIAAVTAHAETGIRASNGSGQMPETAERADAIADAKLRLLLESHKADPSSLTSFGFSLKNPKLQKELYQQFKKDCPDLLENALKSAGNMHNPKVLPLRAKFSESILKTPTFNKIAEQLKDYGYTIKGVDCEKFSILKDTDPPTFFGIASITLNPRAEPAGADQPATQPADKAPVKDKPSTPTPKVVPR